MEYDHKKASIIDNLSVIGELEHLRRHLLLAAISSDGQDIIPCMVLANKCQKARRDVMKKRFNDVNDRHWCIVKSSARLLQLMEETSGNNLDDLKDLKFIVDEAIQIATGEDISDCEACKKDKELTQD